MKNIYLLLIFAFVYTIGNTQTDVSFTINHKMGEEVFEKELQVKNNLEHDFFLNRLQYYISNVSLIDASGNEVFVEDFYSLVTASEAASVMSLGNHDISSVDKIRFHIGIDEAHNHLDPGQYAADHPLAPKNPSMHWGWVGGYRFIALEGFSTPALDQYLQLHVIDDKNYTLIEVDVDDIAENNTISIELNGDYISSLDDIVINEGLIEHSGINEIVPFVENFRTKVFTDVNSLVNIIDVNVVQTFEVYPNPARVGNIQVNLASEIAESYISIFDLTGKMISQTNAKQGLNQIQMDFPGSYILTLTDSQGVVLVNKQLVIE